MVQDQLKPAWYESLLDRDLVPDPLIRVGIRRLLRERLKQAATADPAPWAARPKALVSLGTPSSLKIRYDNAPAGAVPPGTT